MSEKELPDGHRYGYVKAEIPHWLAFADLSVRARMLAVLLFASGNRKGRGSIARPVRRGLSTVRRPLRWYSQVLGCSKRTAQQAIAELETFGLVLRGSRLQRLPGGEVSGSVLTLRLYVGRWNALIFSGTKRRDVKDAKDKTEEQKPLLLQQLEDVATPVIEIEAEKREDVAVDVPATSFGDLPVGVETSHVFVPPWQDDALWGTTLQDEHEADLEWEREKARRLDQVRPDRLGTDSGGGT